MKSASIAFAAALALGAASWPMATLAQARVVSSSPAEGAVVSGPKVLALYFSEALAPATAGVSIVMTAMPGMANHGEMIIRNFTPGWSEDNRKLTLTLRQPLRAGTYEVRWQGAGADGHRVTGKVTFTVR